MELTIKVKIDDNVVERLIKARNILQTINTFDGNYDTSDGEYCFEAIIEAIETEIKDEISEAINYDDIEELQIKVE